MLVAKFVFTTFTYIEILEIQTNKNRWSVEFSSAMGLNTYDAERTIEAVTIIDIFLAIIAFFKLCLIVLFNWMFNRHFQESERNFLLNYFLIWKRWLRYINLNAVFFFLFALFYVVYENFYSHCQLVMLDTIFTAYAVRTAESHKLRTLWYHIVRAKIIAVSNVQRIHQCKCLITYWILMATLNALWSICFLKKSKF